MKWIARLMADAAVYKYDIEDLAGLVTREINFEFK